MRNLKQNHLWQSQLHLQQMYRTLGAGYAASKHCGRSRSWHHQQQDDLGCGLAPSEKSKLRAAAGGSSDLELRAKLTIVVNASGTLVSFLADVSRYGILFWPSHQPRASRSLTIRLSDGSSHLFPNSTKGKVEGSSGAACKAFEYRCRCSPTGSSTCSA